MAQDTGGNNSAQTLVDIIRAYIIDNTIGAVNPAKLRTVLEAIANSVTASSGTAISATPPLNFDAFTNVFSLPVINDLVTGGGNVPLSAEQGVELKKLIGTSANLITDKIYAIARIDTGGLGSWYKINDANHEPSANTQEVLTDPATGYNFAINHNNGYDKVGYVQATIDETYASMGLLVGPSVGKVQSLFRVCRNGFSIRMAGSSTGINFSEDIGQLVKPDDFVASFDTSTSILTITHANVKCTYGDMGLLTAQHPCPYTFRFVDRTETTSRFYIMNNGVPVTTALGSTFKAVYTKLGTFIMQNRHFANSGGNIWIEGEFPI